MLMSQTRNRRAAARVEVAPPFAVDEKHAFASDSERIAMMDLALQDVGHRAGLRLRGGLT
jgi:hypothetical protein